MPSAKACSRRGISPFRIRHRGNAPMPAGCMERSDWVWSRDDNSTSSASPSVWVGPASLAEQSQKIVHEVIASNRPQGWDTQLGNEPGVVATYLRSWREAATLSLSGAQLDLTPH